jgi:hypothetical protein
MSNEVTTRVGLTVRKSSGAIALVDYNRSASYQSDMAGAKGPTVGALTITTAGEAISLAEVTDPGWCWLHNQSALYRISIGIREPDTDSYYPMLDLLPGMRLPVYLSTDLTEQYEGSGTGTGVANNQLWAKAHGGSADLLVELFER